jgi:tRNA pseudouridine65 synthase
MIHTPEPEIVYKDDYFVAVNKPAGLLVHRSMVDPKEKFSAVQMVRDQLGCKVYPVHRLDRPTSGVLLFALDPEIAKKCAQLFCAGTITKKYLAVLRGYLPDAGVTDHPVKEVRDRFLDRHDRDEIKRYPAMTEFKCLAKIELPVFVDKYPQTRYSLAELFPKTGRRHQLRQHMKHLSHPIVGDTRYGKSAHNRFFHTRYHCKRLLLAAVELRFIHPETGADIIISADPGPDFAIILKEFGWNLP